MGNPKNKQDGQEANGQKQMKYLLHVIVYCCRRSCVFSKLQCLQKNAKNAIKKLQRVAKEKDAQRLEHRHIKKVEGEALRKKEEKVLEC